MGRPKKQTADYFPHFVLQGKTMYILESKYGNDGYAFWFKLLELLCITDGHCYNCNQEEDWQFLVAKTKVSEETAYGILDALAKLGAIDPGLWGERLIWSQNLVDNLSILYSKRSVSVPEKPHNGISGEKTPVSGVSGDENPQSIVEESIEEDSKGNYATTAREILAFLNQTTKRQFEPVDGTLKPIVARLKEGFTDNDCRLVVVNRWERWGGDPKMEEFVRPKTVFGKEKFPGYLAEARKNKPKMPQTIPKCPGCGKPLHNEERNDASSCYSCGAEIRSAAL